MAAILKSILLQPLRVLLFSFPCCFISLPGFGQHYPNYNLGKSTRFFSDTSCVQLTISAELKSLLKDVGDERNYHHSVLSYIHHDSLVTIPVKIKTRGYFRRKRTICNFAPLKIDFNKKYVKGTFFEDQEKLKLVTHCNNRRETYEQNLLVEYLLYKTYGLLTKRSYGVRLARIRYTDTAGKFDPLEKYGFFIERSRDVAMRNNARSIKVSNIPQYAMDTAQVVLLSLFQYFAGNTDWSVPGLHNIKLIQIGLQDPYLPIPYDFDWSGMVNARYAKPSPVLGISSVRERVFRGLCREENDYIVAVNLFLSKKEEIYTLYKNFSPLKPKRREACIRYIDDFYEIIENPRNFRHNILNNCRAGKGGEITR